MDGDLFLNPQIASSVHPGVKKLRIVEELGLACLRLFLFFQVDGIAP